MLIAAEHQRPDGAIIVDRAPKIKNDDTSDDATHARNGNRPCDKNTTNTIIIQCLTRNRTTNNEQTSITRPPPEEESLRRSAGKPRWQNTCG